MEYTIDNIVIKDDILSILNRIKYENLTGKLQMFEVSGTGIKVQCPWHSGGHEQHPSCFINLTSNDAPYLWVHCFTCGSSYSFEKFVAECFGKPLDWAKEWLISNYGIGEATPLTHLQQLEPIELPKTSKEDRIYLDESILDSYESYHPYMTKRKLSKTIKQFGIKYDPKARAIIFPTRDINGKLTGISRRSVDTKKFDLGINMTKEDVFCLYVAKKYNYCVVCESQFNALTCWEHDIPAIALYGAGTTKSQMEVINKSPIRVFYLAYDPDPAGEHGRERFKSMLSANKIAIDIDLPKGKDVNDLTEDEFNKYIKETVC